MLHTNRPLQEKMTLFWHNHFATGYNKIAGALTAAEAARYFAAKASEDPGGVQGQIEMLRANALGNFQQILVNIAKDTAMLVWLDGRTNVRTRPQENFAREIMELFTLGVKDVNQRFKVRYIMDNGTLSDNPSAGPDGVAGNADDVQANLAAVRQVRFTVSVRSRELNSMNQPYRETMTSTFSTRNLGYDAN